MVALTDDLDDIPDPINESILANEHNHPRTNSTEYRRSRRIAGEIPTPRSLPQVQRRGRQQPLLQPEVEENGIQRPDGLQFPRAGPLERQQTIFYDPESASAATEAVEEDVPVQSSEGLAYLSAETTPEAMQFEKGNQGDHL
ncbi:hypothetical protein FOZ63_000239 [Perkinsus olseni]|uniref:Uncharacterized protein n=1 Tax=Perkinsus olseni TaxID=32597 RepID=A0A7J6T2T7_PEROL|nr:hypothetical protein FOZ63_000239 [Perkinsus olseni]